MSTTLLYASPFTTVPRRVGDRLHICHLGM